MQDTPDLSILQRRPERAQLLGGGDHPRLYLLQLGLVSPAHPMKPLPIGFKLDPPASATGLPLSSKELSQLRLRGRDAERIQDLDSIQTR